MAPLTAQERRIVRAKNQLVQGLANAKHLTVSRDIVTTSTSRQRTMTTKKARIDTVGASTVVSRAVNPEPEFEPVAPTPTFFTPVQFAHNDWRSNLLIGKYDVKDGVSLWDSRFPVEDVVDQLTVPEDKKMIEDLGVEQSLEAIQIYSLWAASLAAESKKLVTGISEQCRRYQSQILELQGRVQELERQRKVLKDTLTHTGVLLKEAKQECESLKISAVHEYENGFMSALGRVMEKFPGLDLKVINPD